MRENAYYDFIRAFFVRAFIIKSALLETGHVSRSQIVCLVSERYIGDPDVIGLNQQGAFTAST